MATDKGGNVTSPTLVDELTALACCKYCGSEMVRKFDCVGGVATRTCTRCGAAAVNGVWKTPLFDVLAREEAS